MRIGDREKDEPLNCEFSLCQISERKRVVEKGRERKARNRKDLFGVSNGRRWWKV
jgi:hypothetical protein